MRRAAWHPLYLSGWGGAISTPLCYYHKCWCWEELGYSVEIQQFKVSYLGFVTTGLADLAGHEGIWSSPEWRTSGGLWWPPFGYPQARKGHWEAHKFSNKDDNEDDSNRHDCRHLYHCFTGFKGTFKFIPFFYFPPFLTYHVGYDFFNFYFILDCSSFTMLC